MLRFFAVESIIGSLGQLFLHTLLLPSEVEVTPIMNSLPESTLNLLLSGLMGVIGGLFSIPINAYILWRLKRDELYYQHKLEVIAKERELYLQHRLEMKLRERDQGEIAELKATVAKLEQRFENG